jgi:hypothetical protein
MTKPGDGRFEAHVDAMRNRFREGKGGISMSDERTVQLAKALYEEEPSLREALKPPSWESLTPEGQATMLRYAERIVNRLDAASIWRSLEVDPTFVADMAKAAAERSEGRFQPFRPKAIDVEALTAALRQHRDKDQRFTPPLVTDEVTGRSRYATSSEFAAELATEYGTQLLYRAGAATSAVPERS